MDSHGIQSALSRRVKTVTVSRGPSGEFFVSVVVEDDNQVRHAIAARWERAVGADFGHHDFLVLSTGETCGHPYGVESEWYRLKILQRRLAKTTKGSNNRTKIRRKTARLHEQVANRRQDFLQKLSTDLGRRFDTVFVDDLPVAGMIHHHTLARRIAQSGWAEFRRYGKHVRVIGRFVPAVLAPLSLWLLQPRSHAGRPSVGLPELRTPP